MSLVIVMSRELKEISLVIAKLRKKLAFSLVILMLRKKLVFHMASYNSFICMFDSNNDLYSNKPFWPPLDKLLLYC